MRASQRRTEQSVQLDNKREGVLTIADAQTALRSLGLSASYAARVALGRGETERWVVAAMWK